MKLIVETNHIELVDEVEAFITEWNSKENYISTNTSGSTGQPKTIQISKKHMIASAKMTGEFLELKANQNALLCLSPKTIGGKMMIVRAIVWNLNLIISDVSSNPLSKIDAIIDFAAMVPLQVSKSIEKENNKLLKIEKLIIGGAPINPDLENKLTSFPNSIYHTFGMTETISHIALRNISKKENNYSALPGVSFSTSNECLMIDAPGIGVNQLESNDIVDLINTKSFLWKGRRDFIINSGGIKYSPEQIERKIKSLLSCPYFVTGLPDDLLGQKIVLILETKKKHFTKLDFELILDKFEVPKAIYFLDSFKRSESDKIIRNETLKLLIDAEKQIL